MSILGLIPEPPFGPRSWSGSSAGFFHALQRTGLLLDAEHVRLSALGDLIEKARVFSWPLPRWKERYHASVPRFEALTLQVRRILARQAHIQAVLQIGAWFSAGSVRDRLAFSYHDGNAALWYRLYGRRLLSRSEMERHLSWESKVYAKVSGIFVMSSWLASSFLGDFSVPSDKVHVVGAGINFGELPMVPARDFSTARFLFVGKDFERKGGRDLLEAFRRVRRQIDTAELTIVGPTLELHEPGIKCVGYLSKSDPVDAEELKSLFRSATAIVLPSIYEPFGISLTEGMAYGLPCIAADRCAMPEIVKHGETGLIAAAEDPVALANAMLELAANPLAAAEMGRAGRLRVEREFTWDAVAGKIQLILRDRYGIR